MSDTKPIVYAYLDLAESQYADSSNMLIPMSNGCMICQPSKLIDKIDLCEVGGIVCVREPRAFEVAEREVCENWIHDEVSEVQEA